MTINMYTREIVLQQLVSSTHKLFWGTKTDALQTHYDAKHI